MRQKPAKKTLRALNFPHAPADPSFVGKIVFYRCSPFEASARLRVVEAHDLEDVVRELKTDQPVMLLIGTRVPVADARAAMRVAGEHGAAFLRVRPKDSPAWLRRLVEYALKG